MSCSDDSTVGGPVVELKAKRSFDEVPVTFDWHDFLANLPLRGKAYALAVMVRLPRGRSTGFQYECTTAGVTGAQEPRWPKTLNGTVTDGSVVWTARALAATSLRTTVSTHQAPAVTGVNLGTITVDDHIYTVPVSGGTSGQVYDIKHQIACANGEDKEAVGKLPVED